MLAHRLRNNGHKNINWSIIHRTQYAVLLYNIKGNNYINSFTVYFLGGNILDKSCTDNPPYI